MKRSWSREILTAVALTLFAATAQAGGIPAPERRAAIEQEVRDTLGAEQRALAAEGCEGALAFFADREPLFVVNGRTMPTKLAVRSGCGGKKPAAPSDRELQHHAVQVLSETTAYSVSSYRGKTGAIQVVTKIWEKGGEGWRIVHAHESVAGR